AWPPRTTGAAANSPSVSTSVERNRDRMTRLGGSVEGREPDAIVTPESVRRWRVEDENARRFRGAAAQLDLRWEGQKTPHPRQSASRTAATSPHRGEVG